MKNIAIITARSGSKGIKDKNIRILNGMPLMAYSIQAAIDSDCFDTIMVSTDSIEYAQIAERYGAEVPFLRTIENSSDIAGSWEVVDEVLNRYRKLEKLYDSVCLLQPTSPLRTANDIVEGYKMLNEKSADAITAVCDEKHPETIYLTLSDDCSLSNYRNKNGYYLPRQMQRNMYRINGALYIRKIIYHKNSIETLCSNEYAYIMDKQRSIDIDNEQDFAIAEIIMEVKKSKRLNIIE